MFADDHDNDTETKIDEFASSQVVHPMIDNLPRSDFAQIYQAPIVPERGLLAAILERAIRDLEGDADSCDRKSAISWFTTVDTIRDEGKFTFHDVVLQLDLGAKECATIRVKVQLAKEVELSRLAEISKRKRRFLCTSE